MLLLAALTIASTSCVVMSPSTAVTSVMSLDLPLRVLHAAITSWRAMV
jgi:hypothetical protein